MFKIFYGIIVLSFTLGILLLIYRKKMDICYICKTCHCNIKRKEKICKKCGTEINGNTRERVIKKREKKILNIIYALTIAIIGMVLVSAVMYSNKGNIFYDLSGSTGVYMQKTDNTISTDDYWLVKCKALSSGTFKKSIKYRNIKKIMVQGKTDNGKLTLKVISNNREDVYDISNTKGEIEIRTNELNTNSIKFAVTHSKSDYIYMKIRWC